VRLFHQCRCATLLSVVQGLHEILKLAAALSNITMFRFGEEQGLAGKLQLSNWLLKSQRQCPGRKNSFHASWRELFPDELISLTCAAMAGNASSMHSRCAREGEQQQKGTKRGQNNLFSSSVESAMPSPSILRTSKQSDSHQFLPFISICSFSCTVFFFMFVVFPANRPELNLSHHLTSLLSLIAVSTQTHSCLTEISDSITYNTCITSTYPSCSPLDTFPCRTNHSLYTCTSVPGALVYEKSTPSPHRACLGGEFSWGVCNKGQFLCACIEGGIFFTEDGWTRTQETQCTPKPFDELSRQRAYHTPEEHWIKSSHRHVIEYLLHTIMMFLRRRGSPHDGDVFSHNSDSDSDSVPKKKPRVLVVQSSDKGAKYQKLLDATRRANVAYAQAREYDYLAVLGDVFGGKSDDASSDSSSGKNVLMRGGSSGSSSSVAFTLYEKLVRTWLHIGGTSAGKPDDSDDDHKTPSPKRSLSMFNKIYILENAIKKWSKYDVLLLLDADAMVVDYNFDPPSFLTNHTVLAACAGGPETTEKYMINNGVTIWNLRHPRVREMADNWKKLSIINIEKGIIHDQVCVCVCVYTKCTCVCAYTQSI
jgi:hypothetical protein